MTTAPGTAGRRLAFIAQLYQWLEERIDALVAAGTAEADWTTADQERRTREVGLILRTYEKLCEFDDRARQTLETAEDGGEHPDRTSERNAEVWRAEIARRIRRLEQDAQPGDSTRTPER